MQISGENFNCAKIFSLKTYLLFLVIIVFWIQGRSIFLVLRPVLSVIIVSELPLQFTTQVPQRYTTNC